MTADKDDHIPLTNSAAWVNQVKVNTTPHLLWSHMLLQPCATELVLGGWGQEERPKSSWNRWLMSKKKSFLTAMNSCSLPSRGDVVLEPETYYLLPIRPTWDLDLACFLWSLLWRFIFPKVTCPSSIQHLCPSVLSSDFCLWLYNSAQWCHKQVVWKMVILEKISKSPKIPCLYFHVC